MPSEAEQTLLRTLKSFMDNLKDPTIPNVQISIKVVTGSEVRGYLVDYNLKFVAVKHPGKDHPEVVFMDKIVGFTVHSEVDDTTIVKTDVMSEADPLDIEAQPVDRPEAKNANIMGSTTESQSG